MSGCASSSSSAGFPATSCAARTAGAGDVSPLRARRVAEALQALRASADFQALAVLFKRVKNIARELAGRAARWTARR